MPLKSHDGRKPSTTVKRQNGAESVMRRALDSDQLGKIGEAAFEQLCIAAGLIPNNVSWDRKGWDFVVDWRHDAARTDFDSRPVLPTCLVQVKTQWNGAKSVSAPLLALEHLAKDLRPAFIFVLHVTDDLTSAAAYLAHLRGDLLAFILKSLREVRAAKKRLSGRQVRLALDDWFTPLLVDHHAFRQSLEAAIGPSMSAYAEAKQRQLDTLGFEHGHMDVSVKLAGNRQEITDAFLGLRPIQVTGATAVETRFGIPIPMPDFPSDGEWHFSPKSFGHCTMLIYDDPAKRPFRFKGQMYSVPKQLLPENELQNLIRTKLFDLRFKATVPPNDGGSSSINMAVTLVIDPERLRKIRVPAEEWYSLYGFLAAAQAHPVRIEMVTKKKIIPNGTFTIHQSDADWAAAAKFCKVAERIFEAAGWRGSKLAIEDIWQGGERLAVLDALTTNPSLVGPLTFTTIANEIEDGSEHAALYIDSIPFGEFSIAYAIRGQMVASVRDQEVVWESKELSLYQVRRIRSRQRDFDQFSEAVRRQIADENIISVRSLTFEQEA